MARLDLNVSIDADNSGLIAGVRQSTDELRRLAQTSQTISRRTIDQTSSSGFQGTTRAISRLSGQVKYLDQQLAGVATRGLRAMETGLIATITGAKSASESLKQLSKTIINDLLQAAIRSSITLPLSTAFASGANTQSGRVTGFASGGLVSSGVRGTDRIPALLSPGEFVINERATRRWGVLLEAINRGGGQGGSSSGRGTGSTFFSIDARGADTGVESRIRDVVLQTLQTHRGEMVRESSTLAQIEFVRAIERGGAMARVVGRR